MPTYATWETFAAGMAIAAAGKSDKHHNALCYFSTKFGAHDYACWASIQQYKVKQSKRRAIFIYDTWVKDSSQQFGSFENASTELSIFDKINPGSSESGKANQEKALGGAIAGMKAVKTWTGKLSNWGQRAAMGATPANLFNDLEDILGKNMFDHLKADPFNPDKVVKLSGSYAKSVVTGTGVLKGCTFEPDPMGIW